jgi:hypothetical protein
MEKLNWVPPRKIHLQDLELREGLRRSVRLKVEIILILSNFRFYALNPHGTLDFYLPNEGNISEYVGKSGDHSH